MKQLTFLLLLTAFFSSCKKGNGGENSTKEPGLVTTVGTPTGTATTKVIGTAGGTLSTPDNSLTVQIPAGTLSSDQTISIQPITNTNPASKGAAYRITPHDITFSKPIQITFTYTDDQVDGSAPSFLSIAYQNKEGIWMAISGAEVNQTTKKLTVNTTHFSDWSLLQPLVVTTSKNEIAPKGTVELKVESSVNVSDMEDLLAPLVPTREVPVTKKQIVDAKYVEKWNTTAGSVQANGAQATFTAPMEAPANNQPIPVSVELKQLPKTPVSLIKKIGVMWEGIKFRVNGGNWIYTDAGTSMGQHLVSSNSNYVSGSIYENGTFKGAISINWTGNPTTTPVGLNWKSNTVTFTYRIPGSPTNTIYYETYTVPPSTTPINSPGYLKITGYGAAHNYITGSFQLEKAGKSGSSGETITIEGSFNVKRSNDQ
jgi:hypothetical protein